MKFTEYQYLWPPRPEQKVMKPMLGVFEKRGFVAQAKKNGTCSVLAVSPDKQIVAMNRHNETHKLWNPTEKSSRIFKELRGKGWYVFVTELLHSKVTEGPKDTNFINDILVHDGEYLVGKTLAERQALLQEIFPPDTYQAEDTGHFVLDGNTWLAKNVTEGFGAFFDKLDKPEDEGVVLKDPKAKLAVCSRQAANVAWSVKCRRPHKNYGF